MDFRTVAKALTNNGWVPVRTSGSHFQFKKGNGPSVTVPNHGHKDIPLGTLKNIEKSTGLRFS